MTQGAHPGMPWRFARLYSAPHRIAFAAGAAMLAASALWWATAMLTLAGGHPLRFGLPPFQSHGLVMTLGFMPLFFTGFLFTAGPRWLGHAPVDAAELRAPLLAQLSGWAVFLLGVHGPDPAFGSVLGGIGLAAVAVGWTQVCARFVAMLRASPVADRTHARVIAAAGAVGALCMWAAAIGVALAEYALVRAALHVGLWCFVGGVFAAVSHRMIPFFSASALPVLDAWRPLWLLWSFIGLLGMEGVFATVQAWRGGLPSAAQALLAVIELPAGVALLALALRWGLLQSLRIRLLAMLHLGFVWLGLAFVLAGLSHALGASSGGALGLGVAPLHAYTMGFLGSTLLAMVSRVSAGHSGRPLAADNAVWCLFWALQVAALARVVAAVLAANGSPGAMPLIATAAVVWSAVCITWAARYTRWYGTPRADGRPG
ncbi:MAG: NnrS family protein [Burkholderiales bacterium]|nr:NnrS family protein [Burkholderiales bacterium]